MSDRPRREKLSAGEVQRAAQPDVRELRNTLMSVRSQLKDHEREIRNFKQAVSNVCEAAMREESPTAWLAALEALRDMVKP